MALAHLRRKTDNVLICNFLASEHHNEGWMGNRSIHHTIAGNTIPQKVAVMEYGITLGLVFATDDPINTPERMDIFYYDVNNDRHFTYVDPDGEVWYLVCISGWPEHTALVYGEDIEWTVVATFKLEGYIP